MRAEKKELHPRSCFEKDRLAKKKLTIAHHEVLGEAVSNMA
jgi:hypothetical protein